MLRQASVSDLITDRVSRDKAYIVITMRRYPRFVNREYRDEYLNLMSPLPELHEDWLSAKRRYNDHDGAFARSRFEERFQVGPEGLAELARLSRMARTRDVYLICQCPTGKRCHRELLLMMAREWFGAKAEAPRNDYPIFARRLKKERPEGLTVEAGREGVGLRRSLSLRGSQAAARRRGKSS